MSSIQHWVGPRLPHWMARASGIALIVVGLSWPALTWPVPILATTGIAAGLPASLAAADALAQTPPMGWNGFNRFLRDVSEARVEAQARALVASGMQAAGYEYVNLDGGWDLLQRGPQGELQPDPAKFPHGIKPVADYVHSLGLKFGIYTSAGVTNCATHSAGSYGHFQQDAAAFASWGVDYVKLDWCRVPYRNYPGMSRQQVSRMLATEMGSAIATSGRAMVYDINFEADDTPWMWGANVANLWRTGQDSQDRWWSMVFNFTHNVQHYSHARPGGWNDPDMLEVGNGGMTAIEYQSEFSLWAEMAAPLIAGTDLAAMSDVTRDILTNKAVIAVDQDPLGLQGRPIASCVQRSSCIASKVRISRVPPPSTSCSSSSVAIWYGSTPGAKSTTFVYARRRGGLTSVKVSEWCVETGMSAFFM